MKDIVHIKEFRGVTDYGVLSDSHSNSIRHILGDPDARAYIVFWVPRHATQEEIEKKAKNELRQREKWATMRSDDAAISVDGVQVAVVMGNGSKFIVSSSEWGFISTAKF